jgi:hypothetical protein
MAAASPEASESRPGDTSVALLDLTSGPIATRRPAPAALGSASKTARQPAQQFGIGLLTFP